MALKIQVSVDKQLYEDTEGLIRRFNREVRNSGLLKDVKFAEMTKREKKQYKRFINERRRLKVSKRVDKHLR